MPDDPQATRRRRRRRQVFSPAKSNRSNQQVQQQQHPRASPSMGVEIMVSTYVPTDGAPAGRRVFKDLLGHSLYLFILCQREGGREREGELSGLWVSGLLDWPCHVPDFLFFLASLSFCFLVERARDCVSAAGGAAGVCMMGVVVAGWLAEWRERGRRKASLVWWCGSE